MKKKIISLLALVMAAAMLLAGCGEGAAPSGTVTPSQEEKEVSLGRIEGGVYENEYIGIGCELDSNWVYYSAEELQELPENASDLFKDTDLEDQVSQYQYIFDMMAENATDLTTININYTKMSVADRLAYLALSEEAVIDQTLLQKDSLIQAYEASGFTVDSMEKVSVTFLGKTRTAIKTTMSTQGIPYYTLQLIDSHLGSYQVTTTLASFMEDKTEQLLALFYVLD